MSKTKARWRWPVRQMDKDVKSQDWRLYGKNKQTEMSATWRSRMKRKDNGKTNEQQRRDQKQETSPLFAVAAVTMRQLCHLVRRFLCCLRHSSKMVIRSYHSFRSTWTAVRDVHKCASMMAATYTDGLKAYGSPQPMKLSST